MPRKPMTPAEKLVGYRLPREASYRDIVLSCFVMSDGTFSLSSEPLDSWLRPAHRKLRKDRLIYIDHKMTIMGGKPFGIYRLTERGKSQASEARARVEAAREARREWTRKFKEKHQEMRKRSAEEAENTSSQPKI